MVAHLMHQERSASTASIPRAFRSEAIRLAISLSDEFTLLKQIFENILDLVMASRMRHKLGKRLLKLTWIHSG